MTDESFNASHVFSEAETACTDTSPAESSSDRMTHVVDKDLASSQHLHNLYSSLNLNTQLKRRIAHALGSWQSPEYRRERVDVPDVKMICRSSTAQPQTATLTLFMTVHNNMSRLAVFNNTITHWTAMMPALQPVLYITPNITEFQNNTFYLIERACRLQWHVAIAPNINSEGYPLIRSLFLASYQLFDSQWYGYANADILFDQSLFQTLLRLESYKHVLSPQILLAGRRHDASVRISLMH